MHRHLLLELQKIPWPLISLYNTELGLGGQEGQARRPRSSDADTGSLSSRLIWMTLVKLHLTITIRGPGMQSWGEVLAYI